MCQRARHLQRHHGAAEEAGKDDDRQAADADGVHLQDDIVAVMRPAENVAEGLAGEHKEILNCGNGLFQEIEQSGRNPVSPMLP